MKITKLLTCLALASIFSLLSFSAMAADHSDNMGQTPPPPPPPPHSNQPMHNQPMHNQPMHIQPMPSPGSQQFNPAQVKQIEKIVHDYLVKNPQVLVEASNALADQQAKQAQQAANEAIHSNKQKIFNDPNTPVAGNNNGNAVIVEFFDYQCGHCKAMSPVLNNILKDDKNVKMVFKELPIFGGNSRYAAKAALAAWKQGSQKYYKFHEALMNTNGPLNEQMVMKVAKNVGLNTTKLKAEMNKPWVNTQLRDNFTLARQLKLMGTPAIIVADSGLTNFRFIPGATSKQNLEDQITAVTTGTDNQNS